MLNTHCASSVNDVATESKVSNSDKLLMHKSELYIVFSSFETSVKITHNMNLG